MLSRVVKKPLKPQQKVVLLRDNILPKFTHELVLGRIIMVASSLTSCEETTETSIKGGVTT